MTDHAELRRLARLASGGNWYGEDSQVLVGKHAIAYCNHKVDAQFIGEANPKTVLALLDENDRLKAENEVLRGALQAVVDDPTWRSNDNTLWPKIIKAMNPQGATSSP
ncbi:TPA: ead/Ea22-like family protein [Pseudomonas aeruginosa]|nr:ead/Ea22-like family protein [Pseudomonas aeruginosa]HBO9217157.1 ead/Ea22-like family protein [Pseudomonas aeruginosa]